MVPQTFINGLKTGALKEGHCLPIERPDIQSNRLNSAVNDQCLDGFYERYTMPAMMEFRLPADGLLRRFTFDKKNSYRK